MAVSMGRYAGPVDRSLTITTADAGQVATIVDWAADEGWNPGLSDAQAFHTADPGGFLLGSIDGAPVAAISLVRYGAGFAFLGLYIVRPAWRGRGHGMSVWRAAIERAGARRIGLDGVVEHQADYRRSGFVLARRNIRFGGVGGGIRPKGLVPLKTLDRKSVVDYDAAVFPARRRRFLDAWIAMPGVHGLVAVSDSTIRGYGVARPCRDGVKVGPLFAEDEDTAEAIFSGLSAWATGRSIFLDVPEPHEAALRLAGRHGLSPVFETARMYAGTAPDEPVHKIYGVTTFELG